MSRQPEEKKIHLKHRVIVKLIISLNNSYSITTALLRKKCRGKQSARRHGYGQTNKHRNPGRRFAYWLPPGTKSRRLRRSRVQRHRRGRREEGGARSVSVQSVLGNRIVCWHLSQSCSHGLRFNQLKMRVRTTWISAFYKYICTYLEIYTLDKCWV